MSTEIIILVVGVLCILIAIGIGDRFKGKEKASPNIFKVFVGILGILLIIFSGYYYEPTKLPPQIERSKLFNKKQVSYPIKHVQIISPVDKDSVGCRFLIMGVYPKEHTKDIWVLLKPSDDKYYPQSDYTSTSYKRNGEWQVLTRFGGDKNEEFDVVVFETDAEASQFFNKTLVQWKEANDYSGLLLDQIPAGAKKVDEIKVVLSENCRGVHETEEVK
ncbi:hypothetical protein [Winogradskyella sp.]|uniref:hypothetical protein n=1 Tax=Winogradskyella sp. TaxID=1883156 RepID=UPI0025EFB13C|nr:hypothetical protein [Winogradskyella sp.]MBT8244004.1 hypothetical protein [Winogradskyella sp.]